MKQVRASAIAAFLDAPLVGADISVEKPAPLTPKVQAHLMFAKSYSDQTRDLLNTSVHSLVLAHKDYANHLKVPHILCANPRLEFAKVVQKFFAPLQTPVISSSAVIHPSAKLGKDTSIGEYTVIGEGVVVGEGCSIAHHVIISPHVTLGQHVVVKSGTVIGEKGFGFEYDVEGRPIALPHIGSVVIGDYVEIGAQCTVVAGTLANTILDDHVKTDDHVHIAHNVRVGKGTAIAACAEISGSVKIGEGVWVGPNSSIIDGVDIGQGAYIGVGSVVIRDVPAFKVVVGNPARILRDADKKQFA